MTEERNLAKEAAQRWGHYHELMPITKEETESRWDLTCYGCEKPILDKSFYGCKNCQFFLHQSCRDLPRELTHPYHPQHPLTFRPIPAYQGTAICDICRGECKRFTYHCSLCKYDIDMKCALMGLSIQSSIDHTNHPHKLIPLQKESMFSCDACGEEHKGASFLCTTCGLWINQKCASSPLNLKLTHHHHHTLSLSYAISKDDHQSYLRCKICSERIYRRYWVYRCSECRCFVHFHCAVSAKEHSTYTSALLLFSLVFENNEMKTEELDSTNSATITSGALSTVSSGKKNAQELDDSVDIITQFIKNAGMQGKHKEAAEITHRSHEHPLTYFEKPINHTANLSSLLNGARNYEKCNGCAQSISPSVPFYHCVQCHFFLHMWCAELPADELYHPGHPQHTLSLITWEPKSKLCDCCIERNTTLHYACKDCKYILDYKCASLPGVINHEIDKHTLALRPISLFNSECISCSDNKFTLAYTCGTCKLNLCISCALFPRTVWHRYDKHHPFTLTYSPPLNYTKDDFCEICEEEIDSKQWFYHCGECNLYLHTGCIFHDNVYPSMRYGRRADYRRHSHRIAFRMVGDRLKLVGIVIVVYLCFKFEFM
ncbi:hypothetical protein Vadar_000908 [Vaccinium darrowii]|uniref:Uncharacterized protein n=1 Tax=Vaccinium darrowii TaxID=229202 RepID=A0ACB7YIN5_9ERIC|nr:hypothetical protein Vadar_000908 [Vaccinium darrowii]